MLAVRGDDPLDGHGDAKDILRVTFQGIYKAVDPSAEKRKIRLIRQKADLQSVVSEDFPAQVYCRHVEPFCQNLHSDGNFGVGIEFVQNSRTTAGGGLHRATVNFVCSQQCIQILRDGGKAEIQLAGDHILGDAVAFVNHFVDHAAVQFSDFGGGNAHKSLLYFKKIGTVFLQNGGSHW